METINVRETRPLFLTKEGMPRKERLMTIEEACEELDKPISEDPIKRNYQLRTAYAVMGALKKFFREHHIQFIAPRIEGKTYYGFSGDPQLVENYISQVHKLALSYRRIENDVKMISAGQLPLLPIKASGE
jgi:hypothetical protein